MMTLKIIDTKNCIHMSIRPALFMFISLTKEEHPSTSVMFIKLLPEMLPIARSPLPLNAAERQVTNSGKDVPRATMVRPIVDSGIQERCNFNGTSYGIIPPKRLNRS